MNAIISGSAGVAVVVDGKKLFSIDIDRLRELVPRRANEVRFLFGDARDHQLKSGAPIYAAKSLCDLAAHAQRKSLYELQVDLLRRATQLRADDAWAWGQLGKALLNVNSYREALSAYENARQYDADAVTDSGGADVLKAMGNLPDALRAYEEATKAHPENVVAKNGLANVLAAMGRWDEALACLSDALPGTAQDWIGFHLRGMILLRSGNLAAAEQIFEHGVQQDPGAASRDYYRTGLAVVRLRRRQYRSVLELLAQVSLPLFQVPANVLRTHALCFEGDVAGAAATHALLPNHGLPVYVDLRDELGRRCLGEPPRHDEAWLIDHEIELLAA